MYQEKYDETWVKICVEHNETWKPNWRVWLPKGSLKNKKGSDFFLIFQENKKFGKNADLKIGVKGF